MTLGAILLWSTALGLMCVCQFKASPFFAVPMIDEEAYVEWADEIAAGEVLGKDVFYQDPLYPYFLAVIFKLLGHGFLAVRIIQVLMGTASVYLVYWTGRRLAGESLGLLAAFMLSLYGGLYFFELLILKASMLILASAGSCALGVWAAQRPDSRPRWVFLGASLGLLALLRGNFLLMAPVLGAWAWFASPSAGIRPRLLRMALFGGAFVAVILPVSVRNYMVSDEFVVTTSQGGDNFYVGNNERADGSYVAFPRIRPHPRYQAEDFRRAAQRRTGVAMTLNQSSRFWFGEGLRWIRNHPGRAARLWLFKARLMVHQLEVPSNHSFYLVRDEFVSVLRLAFLGFGLLCGPALWGALCLVRREKRAAYPALFAASYGASLVPFFVVARYRLPLAPALALFAAYFMLWVLEKARAREARALASAAVVVAGLMVWGLAPIGNREYLESYGYQLLGVAYLKSGQPAMALESYDRALTVIPHDGRALASWREVLAKLGPDDAESLVAAAAKPDRGLVEVYEIAEKLEGIGHGVLAIPAYERVLELESAHAPAHARLAWLYATESGLADAGRAAGHFERALELVPAYRRRPWYADTANAIGERSLIEGASDEAVAWWKRALTEDPGHEGARSNLEERRN